MAYQTKQGQALADYLRGLGPRHVSAAEIGEALSRQMGVATVYRQLEKLVEQGLVQKFVNDGGPACYQYVGGGDCRLHFHLKCGGCGRLIHLECEELDRLSAHILAEHGFQMDPGRTALYGTCAACMAGENAGTAGERPPQKGTE